MKRTVLFFIIAILLGASISATAGEYGADFLRIGVGARPLAMGGAFVAINNDASSSFWNPAATPHMGRVLLQIDHVPLFNGQAQFNAAALNLTLASQMSLNVTWIRLGVEDVPRFGPLQGSQYERLKNGQNRSTGSPEGYFSDAEDAILVAVNKTSRFDFFLGSAMNALRLPMQFSAGIRGKYLHQQLDDKFGTGQGLDAGLLIQIVTDTTIQAQPGAWLGLGVVARDIARTRIAWNTDTQHKDVVPLNMQIGLAASKYFESFDARLTLSFDQEVGYRQDIHAGGEILFFNTVALRGGYFRDNYSVGAGVSFSRFRVDYAFLTHELASTHRVSGVIGF